MNDADLPLTQQRPAWITLVIPALALAALTLLVYWPGLSGPMIFDDLPLLTGPGSAIHRTLRDPASLLRATRPLVDVSFTAQYLIHGQWPMGYRLGNVALHLLAGWILL